MSWIIRYIHIALDTVVLYGVLQQRNMDERSDDARSEAGVVLSPPPPKLGGVVHSRVSAGPSDASKSAISEV